LELLGAARGRFGGGWRLALRLTPPPPLLVPPLEELTAEPVRVNFERLVLRFRPFLPVPACLSVLPPVHCPSTPSAPPPGWVTASAVKVRTGIPAGAALADPRAASKMYSRNAILVSFSNHFQTGLTAIPPHSHDVYLIGSGGTTTDSGGQKAPPLQEVTIMSELKAIRFPD
jgi:hypothetical protein